MPFLTLDTSLPGLKIRIDQDGLWAQFEEKGKSALVSISSHAPIISGALSAWAEARLKEYVTSDPIEKLKHKVTYQADAETFKQMTSSIAEIKELPPMANNIRLPVTSEVNALLPFYKQIQNVIQAWRERDKDDNAWLYDYAEQDLSNAWKMVYRLGVRGQVLEKDWIKNQVVSKSQLRAAYEAIGAGGNLHPQVEHLMQLINRLPIPESDEV